MKIQLIGFRISLNEYFSFGDRFGLDLQISEKLFVMDAGASNSKDIKLLRSHLLELRSSIISVRLFVLCVHYTFNQCLLYQEDFFEFL